MVLGADLAAVGRLELARSITLVNEISGYMHGSRWLEHSLVNDSFNDSR